MGIALEQPAVHVRTRVSFVGVADDVTFLARGASALLPFARGRIAAAAPSPQTGSLDLVDHRRRGPWT